MIIKFDFRDFQALDDRLKASHRAVPIIVQRVLQDEFKNLRTEIRPQIASKTGAVRRHFTFSVTRVFAGAFSRIAPLASPGGLRGISTIRARLGFFGKTTQRTAIAANVMQHGSNVTPKKGKYLWIPLPGNRQPSGAPIISPREVFANRQDFFVGKSKLGNMLAFRKGAADGRPTPLFFLTKAIRVNPRPVPFEAKVKSRMPQMLRNIEKTIAAIIEGKRRSNE